MMNQFGMNPFQCECGYNGPADNFCPNCGRGYTAPQAEKKVRSWTLDEMKELLQHGWKSSDGNFQIRITGTDLAVRVLAEGKDLRIKTTYLFPTDPRLMGLVNEPHPDEEFRVHAEKGMIPDLDYTTYCSILKLWYGSGTLHADIVMKKDNSRPTIDLEMDDSITVPDPEVRCGWTCPMCGSEKELDTKCSQCGSEIQHFMLFALSEYVSTNPPRHSVLRVYKFDDTKLILECGDSLRYIPASVLEPAYETIRKYGIDKWKEYENHCTGLCGGSQTVSYWDGNAIVGTSTDRMLSAGQAYSALMNLFCSAKSPE